MRAYELIEDDKMKTFTCRWCEKKFDSKLGKFCPHCSRFQDTPKVITGNKNTDIAEDKIILDEIFDRLYVYTWEEQFKGAWRGHFKTGNDNIDVDIENWTHRDGGWQIEFSRDSSDKHIPVGYQGITGTGDAIKIFATVIAMIGEFIDVMKPDQIKFSAEKSKEGRMSRSRLYSRMINRFAANNGYKSQEFKEPGEKTVYILTRKEDENESI